MEEEIYLVNKVKSGDHKAFRKLYDQNVDRLYRFMKQYSGNKAQVEDWVQRAFIKSYKNISTFSGNSGFSTWLFSIALNEMRTDFRRVNIIPFDTADIERRTGEEQHDDSFEWDDAMKIWLEQLDEGKRTVFILFEVEGYSHSEIASMLGINENASRTLLFRAKQSLRIKLENLRKTV